MNWRITTHDVRLEEGQEEQLDLAGSTSEEGEIESLLVLIEELSGREDSFEADVATEEGIESSIPGGPSRVFFGTIRAFGRVAVSLRAKASGYFRITVARLGRLKKHLKEQWEKLPCELCKKLAKTLTRSILASFGIGIPTIGKIGEAIGELDLHGLFEAIKATPLWRWITQSGLETLALALLGPLFLFWSQMLAAEDWIYTEACTVIGACTRPTS